MNKYFGGRRFSSYDLARLATRDHFSYLKPVKKLREYAGEVLVVLLGGVIFVLGLVAFG